jgi:DNA-binding response OmpR family regulator
MLIYRTQKLFFFLQKNNACDIEKGLTLGADAYLTKPFSIKKVVQTVLELL